MISRVRMVALLREFEDACLKRYPGDIDSLSDEQRKKRLGLAINDEPVSRLRIEHEPTPVELVCQLAKTPRLLKLILRNTFRTWEELHGEVDLDDILVATTLRFATPQAFDFILEHVSELRGLQMDGIMKDRDARLKAIEAKWEIMTQAVPWDASSAKMLAQFLFPAWQSRGPGSSSVPQGVQIAYPVDYWVRFLVGELGAREIRDQEVFRAILKWKENSDGIHFRDKALPDMLGTDEEFASRFEHFARIFLAGEDFRKLAAQLFASALSVQGAKANKGSVPGFISLWRLALKHPMEEPAHIEWVQSEISNALPISLSLAIDIYYYWRSNSDQDVQMKKRYPPIRKSMVERAKELFSGHPEAYIRTINPHSMWSSYHFCILFSSTDEGGDGFAASDWEWFAELLVSAAEISARVMIPQIACFVIMPRPGFRETQYTYEEKLVVDLFGNRIARLMKVLSQEIPMDGYEPSAAQQVQLAREAAKKWLREHPEAK